MQNERDATFYAAKLQGSRQFHPQMKAHSAAIPLKLQFVQCDNLCYNNSWSSIIYMDDKVLLQSVIGDN
jgi:hypothetical protein